MDIHKPKPWHGFREFLKEVGTIVIGVLVALGAEAVVERLHEDRLSAEARESVRAEINLDLASARQRDAWQACFFDRFAEIGRDLTAAEDGRPFKTISYLGRPRSFSVYTQRWEAAASGGRTSLLSTDEQRDFARVYGSLQKVVEAERDEMGAWAGLRALEGVQRPSAEMIARAREALSAARMADYNMRHSLRGARFYATHLGIKGDAKIRDFNSRGVQSTCLPTSTRREDVASLTGDPDGAP